MKRFIIIVFGLALLGAPQRAAAQAWETPSFMPPRPGNDIGLYLTTGDGYNVGLNGLWRSGNLGVRLDIFDTAAGSRLGGGAETHGLFMEAGPDFPMDVGWTAAGGVVFGQGVTNLWVPVGVTLGRTFQLQKISVQPYLHPRIGLSLAMFKNAAGNLTTNTNLNAIVEFGSDVYVNEDWTLRVAFDVGDFGALGIGGAYHLHRGTSVR